ncbi:MAG: UspA [Zetaproteobacteria bacterium CG2_30_46_52]|nr:MAG: UspA [Zetaproteobacteria bacterium CG2_30_46_52]
MIKHGKILVPTDFSPQSDEALRRACVLAKLLDASVHLLHVIEPPVYIDADLMLMTPIDAFTEIQHQSATKQLAKQAKSVDTPIETHLEDATSSAALAICDFAKTASADLIIIGRHGKKGFLEHLVIGSTAERVVRDAPCSVLVVMPHGILSES